MSIESEWHVLRQSYQSRLNASLQYCVIVHATVCLTRAVVVAIVWSFYPTLVAHSRTHLFSVFALLAKIPLLSPTASLEPSIKMLDAVDGHALAVGQHVPWMSDEIGGVTPPTPPVVVRLSHAFELSLQPSPDKRNRDVLMFPLLPFATFFVRSFGGKERTPFVSNAARGALSR